MLLEVKFKKLHSNSKIPTWGSKNAAGADAYACLDTAMITINPGETKMISLGFSTEFSEGYGAFLMARSGIASKRGLAPANKVGLIDADYRGEWFVPLHNHSSEIQIVEDGERVCQIVFQEVEHPDFIEASELTETERGAGGFGSTGTN